MGIKPTASTQFRGKLLPGKLAILLLASALAVPVIAQEAHPAESATTNPSATTQTPPAAAYQEQSVPYTASPLKQPREGFWRHMNPFARKKWVNDRLAPINDQLSELDEVNAKNAKDILNVDERAQVGIRQTQNTADAANQTATSAGEQAQQANSTAQNALNHLDNLSTTVNGLDLYVEKSTVYIAFRSGQPILSAEARKRLDDLAAKVGGQAGYILELEAHSPASGSSGIEHSERLAEAVKRYLVTEHNLPVYRLHAVALGNVHSAGEEEDAKRVRGSSVHIRLMENSLAAQESTPLQGAFAPSGTEQP